jgi:GT2 family glycosyltransferase
MPSDKIKVFPNINSGGSGGFSRGMLEALGDKERYGLTHVLLMDDDVVFTHYALERAYVFMRLLKKENGTIMLGGAMMKLDEPFIQYAAGERIGNNFRILSSKGRFNMYALHDILSNEIEESINYAAWWFCCFPLEESLRGNLALPLFMQGDDIEFGLRNARMKKVMLNGVCLWHESFEKKWMIQKDYYVIRNESILLSIHDKSFTKRNIKQFILIPIIRNILIYDYKSAALMLRAVEDYLKGFEWLTRMDPQELNNEIMNAGYKPEPLENLPMSFNYQEYRESLIYKETKARQFFRKILLNGLFLKANRDICAPANNPMLGKPLKSNFYRARRVLNYDESTQKGFITEKSLKETFGIMLRMLRVFHALDKRFDKTVVSYREQYKRYITEDFWRKFLKLEA